MKIKSIKNIGTRSVYDISVKDAEHYVLKNGVVTHNTGILYSSNQAFIITKSQEKDSSGLVGWNFSINVEKSRYVREKAKLTFSVLYDSGINKWSGLMDIALESGHVIKPSNGWYQRVNMTTGEIEDKKYRMADTNSGKFWKDILADETFNAFIEKKFQVSNNTIIEEDSVGDVYGELEED